MDCSPTGSSVRGDSPGQNTEVGSHSPSPGDLPNPGMDPGSAALQADSLPVELRGKPYFTYDSTYASVIPSPFIPPSPSSALTVHKSVLHVCVSLVDRLIDFQTLEGKVRSSPSTWLGIQQWESTTGLSLSPFAWSPWFSQPWELSPHHLYAPCLFATVCHIGAVTSPRDTTLLSGGLLSPWNSGTSVYSCHQIQCSDPNLLEEAASNLGESSWRLSLPPSPTWGRPSLSSVKILLFPNFYWSRVALAYWVHFFCTTKWISYSLFTCSVVSDSLQPHGLQHSRRPRPSPPPRDCSNSCPCPSGRWCQPASSSSVAPFSSCLQSFPASGYIHTLFFWISFPFRSP